MVAFPTLNGQPKIRRMLSFAINDSTFGQIIGGEFHANLVTWNDPDEVLSHSSGNVSHHLRPGFQLNAEPSVSQCLCHCAFDLEGFFFFSQNQTSNEEFLSVVNLFHPAGCSRHPTRVQV